MTKTTRSPTLPHKPKSVITELSATPEKFLEDDLKSIKQKLKVQLTNSISAIIKILQFQNQF
jgi:hypothetical protein